MFEVSSVKGLRRALVPLLSPQWFPKCWIFSTVRMFLRLLFTTDLVQVLLMAGESCPWGEKPKVMVMAWFGGHQLVMVMVMAQFGHRELVIVIARFGHYHLAVATAWCDHHQLMMVVVQFGHHQLAMVMGLPSLVMTKCWWPSLVINLWWRW